MKSIIGIILIVVSLILGYLGVNQIQESASAGVVLGRELSAGDKGGKETGYVQFA